MQAIIFPSATELNEIINSRNVNYCSRFNVIRHRISDGRGTVFSIAIILLPGRQSNKDYSVFLAESEYDLNFVLDNSNTRRNT